MGQVDPSELTDVISPWYSNEMHCLKEVVKKTAPGLILTGKSKGFLYLLTKEKLKLFYTLSVDYYNILLHLFVAGFFFVETFP